MSYFEGYSADMPRILFVASLHHPDVLRRERAATPSGQAPFLFPTSYALHFYERAMRRRGYAMEVFYRNLPGYGERDVARLKPHKQRRYLTPSDVLNAAMRRMPSQLNVDYRRRNALLLEQARRFRPDVLWLVGDNAVITPETLQRIKDETGCKLIYMNGVSPIVFSQKLEREAARLYDLVLVNDYYHGMQWMELGAKQMACLPYVAIDPDFHYPYDLTAQERHEYACEVNFVGTLIPNRLYSERVAALEALRGFKLGVWSIHDVPPSLQSYYRGAALGDVAMRVMAAAPITINTHGDFMRYGGNMRLFEAAAVGAFQISDERPGVREWFTPGEHLVVYRSLDELRDLVAYYLAHPQERQAMAEAARQHALAHHTYEQRLTALEGLLAAL